MGRRDRRRLRMRESPGVVPEARCVARITQKWCLCLVTPPPSRPPLFCPFSNMATVCCCLSSAPALTLDSVYDTPTSFLTFGSSLAPTDTVFMKRRWHRNQSIFIFHTQHRALDVMLSEIYLVSVGLVRHRLVDIGSVFSKLGVGSRKVQPR